MLIFRVFEAQCVMCYRTAAAQSAERARVFNAGILIMLIPPILVIAGILGLAWFRGRGRRNARLKVEGLSPAAPDS